MFRKKKKKDENPSFLKDHEFQIDNGVYYRIEIRGEKYSSWTRVERVLADFHIPVKYKGVDFSDPVNNPEKAIDNVKLFCEYIVEFERGNVEQHIDEGNLHEFYVIENL